MHDESLLHGFERKGSCENVLKRSRCLRIPVNFFVSCFPVSSHNLSNFETNSRLRDRSHTTERHAHTLATCLLNMCENQIVPSIDCKLINLQVKRGIPALQHLLVHIPPIVSTQTTAIHSCPREDELAQAELPPVNMLWPSRPILP